MNSIKITLILFSITLSLYPQNHKILESNDKLIRIEYNFNFSDNLVDTLIDGTKFSYIKSEYEGIRNPGEPWLPDYVLQLAVPFGSDPTIKIINSEQSLLSNKLILPCPFADPSQENYDPLAADPKVYSTNIFFPANVATFYNEYIFRYSRVFPLSVAPCQYNPVTRELIFNKKIVIEISYNDRIQSPSLEFNDPLSKDLINDVVINYNQAIKWFSKTPNTSLKILNQSWYDPNKNYYKIFVKEKGVYRITFEELVNSGAPITLGVESDKLAIYNNDMAIPIDVVDNGDSIFNDGDYIQFVGFPAKATEFSFLNIYNNSNIYWFTYENTNITGRYIRTSGFPTIYQHTFQSLPEVVHFEKDSIYEPLGYASNQNSDHWYWGKATANNSQSTGGFEYFFPIFKHLNPDSHYVKIRVNLHGMINNANCFLDNKAHIELTNQPIGSIHWDGQNPITFEKSFYSSDDSIKIFPEGNAIRVWNYGDACTNINSGDIRINWVEFEYWKYLRAEQNNINFKSPSGTIGINRYWLTLFNRDSMIVYIPEKNKIIDSVQFLHDQNNTVLFTDSVLSSKQIEYFCVSKDFFFNVDSIKRDISSDLRNISNGADYIIITHSKFSSVANRLKNIRELNFPDTSFTNPRIKIVDVQDIYDEFSGGMQDPFAIKAFVKYAFENWQTPAPSYVVLLGDMSHDYRQLLTNSRPNFIPSIPYYSYGYGEAASDNQFVAVAGGEDDVVPDLALGRLSIESVEEGNVLLDKIENYPNDAGKKWKQNALLIASGLSLQDEINLGFNDASLFLENNYVKPNGYFSSKVFRYPSKAEHFPFQGEGPKIREEINKGAVLVNYYGHGGGYQWDLVFTNDDIYLLENGGRLPYIISVTCYTAHFDNQNVFGEQFNKVSNKGGIGFFGSAGLTYWEIGKAINKQFFNEVFNKRNFIVGKAILKAKSQIINVGLYATQIALLTNLGDPVLKLALPNKPDFVVTSSDIKINPISPLVNDTVTVKVNLTNLGPIFSPDSVIVELFISSVDTNYKADSTKVASFGETDSVIFKWFPDKGNLYELKVNINESRLLPEMDYSDNTASNFFVVYNISEPNIIKPIDGYSDNKSKVGFLFADIGYYIERDLSYFIEIDTSLTFAQPIVVSTPLTAINGLLSWESSDLNPGVYFWRSRIFDGENYGIWSGTRSFSISSEQKKGYYAKENILKQFDIYNMNYSDVDKSLILNTSILPPRPYQNTFITDLNISPDLPDSIKLNTITSDGTYLYAGTVWFFATNSNPDGYSRIYKFGTGLNGTTAGEYLGTFSNFYGKIYNSIFYHSDNKIYVTTGISNMLISIDIQTEQIDSVFLQNGVLNWENSRPIDGPAYLNSDGQFVYNITLFDTLGNRKYVLRIFDPSDNWGLVESYKVLSGTSYEGFSGFFVADGYIYPSEYLYSNYMRRIRISDGLFEEEWSIYQPFKSYYCWAYDWQNNFVYGGVFRPTGYTPKFSKFNGRYSDAFGFANSKQIGPVLRWNKLNYEVINSGVSGRFFVILEGYNNNLKQWDTLNTNVTTGFDLTSYSPKLYKYLRANFSFVDSSFGSSIPIKLKSLNIDYDELPEIVLSKNNIIILPDSILQGIQTEIVLKSLNVGNSDAKDLSLNFYLNDADTTFQKYLLNISADSMLQVTSIINTDPLLFDNNVKVIAQIDGSEYFTFNNKVERDFYVARDSINPTFNITFDGKEIISGDIISSEPEVVITLEDNSPLPLDSTYFTLVHTYKNIPKVLSVPGPDVKFVTTPYPNNKAIITWTPKLEDGRHVLEVLAKDASGNFFDSTSSRSVFNVFNNPDLLQVYNYPNPFSDNTYFTFELRGVLPPEEFKIKIFTVAGRLIREIIPTTPLQIGFNKIYWDGKDEDGDEIANGLYFYKIISKHNGEIKTTIQKLAKVK